MTTYGPISIDLTFSAFWLLIPLLIIIVLVIAFVTRDAGNGPGAALFMVFVAAIGFIVFLVAALIIAVCALFSAAHA